MKRRTFLLALTGALVSSSTEAQQAELWSALQAGGLAILLRHAQTEPGIGDPPGFRLGDCRTQRNLSEEGRRQARRIGEALAARRVRIDAVRSSEWCRCLETARLAFPERSIQPFPALNSFFDGRAAEPRQTRELRAALASIDGPGNVVFVTHQVNIQSLTGETVGSGEAVLLRAARSAPDVLGRLAL